MNKQRRKWIEDVTSKLYDLQSEIESILEEEQEYMDNMPENLQCSERYETAEAAVDNLESACSSMEELIEYLNDASE